VEKEKAFVSDIKNVLVHSWNGANGKERAAVIFAK